MYGNLADEVKKRCNNMPLSIIPQFGKIYAYEVNGFGSYNLMDDANVPSLLSLPYLDAVKNTDPVYINTRKLLFLPIILFSLKEKQAKVLADRMQAWI